MYNLTLIKQLVNTLIITALLLTANISLAQNNDTATQAFGDWTLECNANGDCAMSQSIFHNDSQQTILRVAITLNKEGNISNLLLLLPHNLYLPDGAKMKVDNVDYATIPFVVCNQSGCHAHLQLNATQLEQLLRMSSAEVVVSVISGQVVTLTISGKGSRAAFNAMRQALSS